MACSHSHSPDTQSALLQAILTELQQVKANQTVFESKVCSIAALLWTRTQPPSRGTARIARSSPHFAPESHRQHPAPRWTLVRGAGDASRQAFRPPDFALARCAEGCRDRQVLAARDPYQCVPIQVFPSRISLLTLWWCSLPGSGRHQPDPAQLGRKDGRGARSRRRRTFGQVAQGPQRHRRLLRLVLGLPRACCGRWTHRPESQAWCVTVSLAS